MDRAERPAVIADQSMSMTIRAVERPFRFAGMVLTRIIYVLTITVDGEEQDVYESSIPPALAHLPMWTLPGESHNHP
jgi:hypothetical protein